MEWIKTAANNAVITKDEVLAWVKLSGPELCKLVNAGGFPPPRYGMSKRITCTSRWRVGDIREYLSGEVHSDPHGKARGGWKSDFDQNHRPWPVVTK